MARDSAGTYSLPAGNPVVTNTLIASTWANPTMTDLANAITDSLSRSGLGGMSAPLLLTDGSASAPGLAFVSDINTGLYRSGADIIGVSTGGVLRYSVNATGNHVFAASSSGNGMTSFGTIVAAKAPTTSLDGALLLSTGIPMLSWNDTSSTVDNRVWDAVALSDSFRMRTANDAGAGNTTWLQVERTAATVDSIALTATATTVSGTLGVTGALSAASFSGSGTSLTALNASNLTSGTIPSARVAGAYTEITAIGNTSSAISIVAAGNVTVNAPSSGLALDVAGTSRSDIHILRSNQSVPTADAFIFRPTDSTLGLGTANTERLRISAGGNVTVNAPSSGIALVVAGHSSAISAQLTSPISTVYLQLSNSVSTTGYVGYESAEISLWSAGTKRLAINSTGATTIIAPSAGIGLTVRGVSGTHSTQIADRDNVVYDAGYLGTPVGGVTGTLVLADRGKTLQATATQTVPNSTFAAGDVVSVYNNSGSAITLTATITTMRLAGTATTGSRTLAARGLATVYFLSGTECIVSGAGVT